MALMTLSELKTALNLTGSDQDEALNQILNGVLSEVKSKTGEIESADFTEQVHFSGGYGFTKNKPITAISTITDEYDNEYDYIEDDDLALAGAINIYYKGDIKLDVAYTAGYSSAPSNIKLYALRLAAYYYYKRPGVKSESLEGFKTDFEKPDERLLQPYLRVDL